MPILLLAILAATPAAPAGPSPRASFARAAIERSTAAERLSVDDLAGVHTRCLAPLSTRGDDELSCRLLEGAALLAEDRFQDAARVLGPARGRLGVLEPYGALLLGSALAGSGEPGALALLDEAAAADPDGPLARSAAAPAAVELGRSGRLDEARGRISGLLTRRSDRAAAALALADATAVASPREAAVLYRAVWSQHPATREALRAEAHLAKLGAEGVEVPPPSAADRLERAARFLDRGLLTEALVELDDDDTLPAALLRGKALAGLGRRDEAERVLAPCVAAAAPADIAGAALVILARNAMRDGGTDRAVSLLERVTGLAAEEASFLAAFFEYDAGRFAAAEERFRRFAQEQRRSRRRDEALFYVGWMLYKQGRFGEAARELSRVEAELPRSDMVPQAQYWRARALARSGSGNAARAELSRLARTSATTWYGLLARQQLGADAPPLVLDARAARIPAPGASGGARLERAAALYAAGLADLAGHEVDAAVGRSRDPELIGVAALLARSAEDHGRAMRIGVDRLGGLAGAADLAYPDAFRHEVDRAAAAFAVDPRFVWAVMRRESEFRKDARSGAAAVGLMQLLPRTAVRIAALIGVGAGHARKLDDPTVNVTLGAWYLAELLGRTSGSYALAAACYNAGPDAVSRWLDDPLRRGLPLDEFVDSIPFRETRLYVKTVVADMQIYRLLGGLPPIELPGELPAMVDGARF